MMKTAHMQKTVVGLVGALALCSCASSAPTQLFTLDPAVPASNAGASYTGAAIRVDAVQIPPDLNRPELLRQTGPDQLRIEDFAHWSAPLGAPARNALTRDLAAQLPASSVIFPDASSPNDVRGLSVNILAFTTSADHASLDVSWILRGEAAPTTQALFGPARPTGPAALATGAQDVMARPQVSQLRRTLRLSVPLADGSPQEQARALSQLLGQVADSVTLAVVGKASEATR